jgi:hypothetical protein
MAFDETTEGFAITLSRPVEVWILVSHSGNYKVLKPWTTNEPPALGPQLATNVSFLGQTSKYTPGRRIPDRHFSDDEAAFVT